MRSKTMSDIGNVLILFLLFTVSDAIGQDVGFTCGNPLKDLRDGHIYQTVLIGDQCWMQQNLNTGKPVKDMQQSDNGIIEKTCYHNDKKWCDLMGGLYSWDEVMQYQNRNQGICPEGWHVPSLIDWRELIAFLGPEAGQKLKAKPGEKPLSWDGTNESGFNAFPSGTANHGYFNRINQWAIFWSSDPANSQRAWFAQLDSYWYTEPPKYKCIYLGNYYLKSNGFSVRCILNK